MRTSFTVNTSIYDVLSENNTAACFDHYLVVFGPLKYTKLTLQLQVYYRVGRLDIKLWMLQCRGEVAGVAPFSTQISVKYHKSLAHYFYTVLSVQVITVQYNCHS
jgi:hypothetical protein